jgi:hypothetical protein
MRVNALAANAAFGDIDDAGTELLAPAAGRSLVTVDLAISPSS